MDTNVSKEYVEKLCTKKYCQSYNCKPANLSCNSVHTQCAITSANPHAII